MGVMGLRLHAVATATATRTLVENLALDDAFPVLHAGMLRTS